MSLHGKRYALLGGGGFLGVNLGRALRLLGAETIAFGRSHIDDAGDGSLHWTKGDLNDAALLGRALTGVQVVFHLVSESLPESSNHNPSEELASGVVATLRLLDLCRCAGVERIVFASSGGAVYGVPNTVPITESAPTNPISAYGISRLMIEKYLFLYEHLYGLRHQILRIANPYGPFQHARKGQGLIGAFLRLALAGKPLEIWGDGEVVRDFIHVDDVINAFIAAAQYEGPHRIMNVGSGAGLSVNDVIQNIELVLASGALERIYKAGRKADVPVNVLDSSLLRSETGWAPMVSLNEGLHRTIAWLRAAHDADGSRRPR